MGAWGLKPKFRDFYENDKKSLAIEWETNDTVFLVRADKKVVCASRAIPRPSPALRSALDLVFVVKMLGI